MKNEINKKEIWKSIKFYEEYHINNFGKIKSF